MEQGTKKRSSGFLNDYLDTIEDEHAADDERSLSSRAL
jgi:hypothetical protein